MDLYLHLDAYDDARTALAALKEGGCNTAILSNGSPKMLEGAVGSADLASVLDDVISIEDVGIYKPDPRVYQLAVDRMGVETASKSVSSPPIPGTPRPVPISASGRPDQPLRPARRQYAR